MPVTNDKNQREMNAYAISLYDEYKRLIYSIAKGIIKDSLTAEDIVQETMLILIGQYSVMQELSEEERYRFVVRIAKNKAIDEYRRAGSVNRCKEELKRETDLFYEDVDLIIEECLDMDLLNSIPLEYRVLLYRKYCCEYSVKELAVRYNISEYKVAYRLRKARELVKKEARRINKIKTLKK